MAFFSNSHSFFLVDFEMEWLKRNLKTQASQTEGKKESEGSSEDTECTACEKPCSLHPSYPESLAKKINQTKELNGTGSS